LPGVLLADKVFLGTALLSIYDGVAFADAMRKQKGYNQNSA
jgi:hypothetical protein